MCACVYALCVYVGGREDKACAEASCLCKLNCRNNNNIIKYCAGAETLKSPPLSSNSSKKKGLFLYNVVLLLIMNLIVACRR